MSWNEGEPVTDVKPRTPQRRGAGRWRTGQQSRQRILDAARTLFTRHGYHATTVRAIATQAHVDPAMIHYFFGGKQALFSAVMNLPGNPASVITALDEIGLGGLGVRLLDGFLTAWDSAEDREPLTALVRSGPTDQASAALLQEFFAREITTPLVHAIGTDDAALRANLISAQLTGLIMTRYLVPIEPLASTPRGVIVDWLAPAIQQLLTGPTPVGRS